jgi:SAM-dependent methyltransferase
VSAAIAFPPVPPRPVIDCYRAPWLELFDAAEGGDQAQKDEEMRVFEELVGAVVSAPEALRYLDIGTCTGRYLEWALRRGVVAVHGVDCSPPAVELTRRKVGSRARIQRVDVREVALESLGLGDMSLVSMMFGTLNHFSPAERGLVLRNVRRCLAADGRFVVSSWQPGKCDFSAYDEDDRALLARRGVSIGELGELLAAFDMRLVGWAHTRSMIVACAAPVHALRR